jgi:hypothetical protein
MTEALMDNSKYALPRLNLSRGIILDWSKI